MPGLALVDLPVDVHFTIFKFLDPLDIIAIGRTCHILREATLQRAVWTTALKNMCALNAAFIPSFFHSELSIKELKKASLGPCKMIALLQDGRKLRDKEDDKEVQLLVAPRTHTIKVPASELDAQDRFFTLFLVPGGRYLVTTGTNFLCIWDLQILGTLHLPIISQVIPQLHDHPSVFCVCPCIDKKTFRVVLLGTWNEEDDSELATLLIYEFREDLPKKELNLFKCPLPAKSHWSIKVFSLHENIFAYFCNQDLHVWNFVDDTCASWRTSVLQLEEMFVDAKNIAVFTRSALLVWDLPDLYPRKGKPVPPSEEIPPRFSVPIDTSFSPDELAARLIYTCERVPDWFNRSHSLSTFDVVSRRVGDTSYQFTTLYLGLPTAEFRGTTENVGSFELKARASRRVMVDARPCNDYIVKCWRDDEHCFILSLAPKITSSAHILPSSIKEIRGKRFRLVGGTGSDSEEVLEYGRSAYSFDVISGRLCAIVSVDEISTIRILDLFATTSSVSVEQL